MTSLAHRLESAFPSLIRLRGMRYQQQDRVRFAHRQSRDPAAWAWVEGEDSTYEVMLDWSEVEGDDEGEILSVSCTCPASDRDQLCKHVWAAVLQADDRGLSDEIPGSHDLEVELVEPGDSPSRTTSQPPKEWRPTLDALRERLKTKRSVPPRRELYLVIDADRSRAGDGLRVEFYGREIKSGDELGPLVPTELHADDRLAAETADDVHGGEIETVLRGLVENAAVQGGAELGARTATIPVSVLPLVLPRLCATGRLGWRRSDDADTPFQPVSWDDGPPFRLALEAEEENDRLRIAGRLERARNGNGQGKTVETVEGSECQLVYRTGVACLDHRVIRLDDAETAVPWLVEVGQRGFDLPRDEAEEALRELWTLPELPELRLPEELRWPEERPDCRPAMIFGAPDEGPGAATGQVYGEIRFEYGAEANELDESAESDEDVAPVVFRPTDAAEQKVRFSRKPSPEARDPQSRRPESDADRGAHEGGELPGGNGDGSRPSPRLVRRDPEAERRHLDTLRDAGVVIEGDSAKVGTERFVAVTRALEDAGWRLEVEGRRLRSEGRFEGRLESGIDWFDLSGAMDFGGQSLELPELLRAAREKRRFVTLEDGSMGLLPQEWLDRYAGLAAVAEEPPEGEDGDGSVLRFGNQQALLLDALLAAEGGVQIDEVFGKIRRRLRTFDELEPQPTPEGFEGELRPYQEVGLGWLQLLADIGLGGCLADDMGLGKTIQVLAHVWERVRTGKNEDRPSLLVVPRTLLSNWQSEAAKFTPKLDVRVYHGSEREEHLEDLDETSLLITTYGTLLRDVVELREKEFDVVALDEAQAIKNPKSKRAKSCRLLRARHRLALTGTPVENHLGELWSILEFLNASMLGRLPALADHADKKWLSPEVIGTVSRALRPLILRRTKGEVLKDLPEKTEQTLFCDLSNTERRRYDELREHYRGALVGGKQPFGKSKILVLEALLRLRQAACHPGLLDDNAKSQPSAKLRVLVERVQEVLEEGHKALVFSQFTQMLGIVRQHVDEIGLEYEYLDGRTRNRQDKVDRFQNDEDCRLFLISLKAGGVGLNLTAASYVFLLDPWWNPAVETQAIDRTHRIGQTQPVFAYRLIARDTVEEKILELQEKKRALADAIIARDDRFLKNLTAEDLELLLS